MPKPLPYLIATDDHLSKSFFSLKTRDDVAKILEVSPQFLGWILCGRRERQEYFEMTLHKKSGATRRICIPPKNLRILQDKLLRIFSLIYHPRSCVTGFTKGKCIIDNALPHARKTFVINFDLKDFFPTIHFGRIYGTLQGGPFSLGSEAAMTIAQIVSHDDGHLPQGAPTSPIIANIVCGPFDTAMLELARANRFRYTRYADDITLSTTQRNLPPSIVSIDNMGSTHVGPELQDLLSRHGFVIRDGKTRARHTLRRQRATGLIINEFPNVPRMFVRNLRALIHDCGTKGFASAAKKYASVHTRSCSGDPQDWITNVIKGKLAYLKMVRGIEDPTYRNLLRRANSISKQQFDIEVPLLKQQGQAIHRRSRRNINWELWVEKSTAGVFRVACKDTVRTFDGFGTAFRVGPQCFVTAGHNVDYRPRGETTTIRRQVFIQMPDESEIELCKIIAHAGIEGDVDLAIGHGKLPSNWPDVFVGTQERLPKVGEEIAALGFPDIAFRQPELVLHVGRVEAVTTGYRGARFINVSFPSGPALSGAPLLDANGFCLGVMVENTFLGKGDAPRRPYGQAIAIGHWRSLPDCSTNLKYALS